LAAVAAHRVSVVAVFRAVDHAVAAAGVHAPARAADPIVDSGLRARIAVVRRVARLTRVRLEVAGLDAVARLTVVAGRVTLAGEGAGDRLAAVERDVVPVVALLTGADLPVAAPARELRVPIPVRATVVGR